MNAVKTSIKRSAIDGQFSTANGVVISREYGSVFPAGKRPAVDHGDALFVFSVVFAEVQRSCASDGAAVDRHLVPADDDITAFIHRLSVVEDQLTGTVNLKRVQFALKVSAVNSEFGLVAGRGDISSIQKSGRYGCLLVVIIDHSDTVVDGHLSHVADIVPTASSYTAGQGQVAPGKEQFAGNYDFPSGLVHDAGFRVGDVVDHTLAITGQESQLAVVFKGVGLALRV